MTDGRQARGKDVIGRAAWEVVANPFEPRQTRAIEHEFPLSPCLPRLRGAAMRNVGQSSPQPMNQPPLKLKRIPLGVESTQNALNDGRTRVVNLADAQIFLGVGLRAAPAGKHVSMCPLAAALPDVEGSPVPWVDERVHVEPA